MDEVLLFDTIDGVNAALAFLKRKAGVADLPDQSDFYRIRATDEIRHLAALRSRKYIVVHDRGVRQEVWVTSWKEAGIGRETLEAVRRLAAAYDKVMSNLGRVPLFREVEYVPTKGLFEIDGFPVAIQHFENGGLRYDVHLRPLAEAPPDPAAFLVPEGYERAWALD